MFHYLYENDHFKKYAPINVQSTNENFKHDSNSQI